MFRLTLPSMVAGRELPNTLVDKFDGDLTGAVVVVDAQRLVSGSPSFAAELLHRLLVVESAGSVEVSRAPRSFAEFLTDAAAAMGVADRLRLTRTSLVDAWH